ncbi:MAG: type VII secretion protein EccE [Jatrophihabitantaceae bacterium]
MTAAATPELGAAHRGSQHGPRSSARVPGPPYLLRWLLPCRLPAVLGWEAAALAVLVGYQHRHDSYGQPSLIGLAVLAGLLVLMTSFRLAGLTGLERLLAGRAMRARLRRYAEDRATDTVQRRLLAGLTLNTHIDRAGNRTGVIGSGLSWSATIKVADSASPDPSALIAAATRACLRTDLPLASAQVLSWNIPSGWGESRSADGRSDSAPRTLRQYFLAVRTAPTPTSRAIRARGGGPSGAQRATASAAAALAFELSRLGYPCTVLDSAELEQHVQLMSGASYSAQLVTAERAPAPLETKDTWAIGQLQQSCFEVGGRTSQAAALNWPAAAPLSFVVGSVTVRPGRRGQPKLSYLMRAAMLNQQSPLTIEQASRALDRRLVPMRYRQERYLRATLPLALPIEPASLARRSAETGQALAR